MSKASSVVASVTQQSWQRVPQSRTEYTECMSSDGTTAWRANDHVPGVVPAMIQDDGWLYTWHAVLFVGSW